MDPKLITISDSNVLKGRDLFRTNCISCHSMEKDLTGPALMGMQDRAPYKNFIEDLLLHPKETLKKSQYAQRLVEKYPYGPHMSFLNILTKDDLRAIVSYYTFLYPAVVVSQNLR